MNGEISSRRAAIDVLDAQLVRLLNVRAQIACELATVKRENGLDIIDHEREQQVLARVCETNTGPLDRRAISRIFQSIIHEARRLQSEGK